MKKLENIILIDTSLGACSAAAFKGDACAVRSEMKAHGQSELLVPMMQEVMAELSLEYKALDAVIVTMGPGAFTGLRIGLSSARALALSADIALYGMSSLQAMVLSALDGRKDVERLRVLIDPRRDDYYMQDFDCKGMPLNEAQLVDGHAACQDLDALDMICGDAAERFSQRELENLSSKSMQKINYGFNSADLLCIGSIIKMHPEYLSDQVEPIYLRGADISQSKKTYRTLASD